MQKFQGRGGGERGGIFLVFECLIILVAAMLHPLSFVS